MVELLNMSKNGNPVAALEMQELIEKLIAKGYGDLIQTLLDNEAECYTKKARLNKSATIRKLGWKNKQLEDALAGMREVLSEEFGLEIEGEEEEEEDEES